MIKPIYLLILLMSMNALAQFGPQQIITTDAANARSVYAADLDGDNDMDVLSASEGDDKVAWYENLDGQGTYGSQHIIDQNLESAIDVYAIDIDGDEDIDVLVASKGYSAPDGKIVWYENLDGLGSFGAHQDISTITDGAISVYAADLDGDNDMDVLSASFMDNKIAWYENLDGLGNFGPQLIITNSALSARDVIAADLDGDTDMDVIATSTGEAEVIWFKNLDGLGGFGNERVITNNALGLLSIYAIDLDGDNDIDVLSASQSDNKVAWYENLNGQGTFGSEQVISTGLQNERVVFAIDLDNDDDIDVLSANQVGLGGEIVWYENLDGAGNFGPHQNITYEAEAPRSVYSVDIDGDGDNDVLSASTADHKIAWYENLTILSIDDIDNDLITISPNPVQDQLVISNNSNIEITSITIYDVLGRLVLVENQSFENIDVSALDTGLFMVNIETERGIIVRKIVKE